MLAEWLFLLNYKNPSKIQEKSKTVVELINLEEDENQERRSGTNLKRRMRRSKRRRTISRRGNTQKILRHVTDISCGRCRNMWPFAQRYSAAEAQPAFRRDRRAFRVQTGPKHMQHNRASVIKYRWLQTWHSWRSYSKKKKLWNWGKALTLILLTWIIWWAPNNASRGQMGFNLAFKRLSSQLCSFSTRVGHVVA